MQNLPPAQLLVGEKSHTYQHIEHLLKKMFCKHAQTAGYDVENCFCIECKKVKNRQHPFIVWVSPEKDYTVDDIEIIFERARYALDPGISFFFILENIHTLTSATANRLLKILEEPPRNYHFVLTSINSQAIIQTILSRCVVHEFAPSSQQSSHQHPLLAFFLSPDKHPDPMGFEQELKKQRLSDSQSIELMNDFMALVTQKLRSASEKNSAYWATMLEFLIAAMRRPPQSGSSEIFWKCLFLKFPR